MDVIKKKFYIEPRHIVYFRFITEGYEGLCLIHTVNGKAGIIEVSVPPQIENEFYTIVEALREELQGDNLTEIITEETQKKV